MKLLTVFILFALVSASASNTYSQQTKLNMQLSNVTVREVFEEIEENSEFILLYNEKSLDMDRKVTVSAKNETVESILKDVFKGTGNKFNIYDRQIVILEDGKSEVPAMYSFGVQQQKSEITGVVKDEEDNPIPGASVVVKGTTVGTITDIDGNFRLLIPTTAKTLIINFVGLKTQEVVIGNQTKFTIILEEESIGIDEVVAVGYGTMKKSDLTGSVVSVQSDQITQTLSTTVEQTLVGRASGVQVTQTEGAPGAGVKIRVRGGTSINASNEPLYVVDGFPIDGGSGNSVTAGIGISKTSVLATMNPNDIESIEILKDASATAIYGSRGANGVIIITTKSGGGSRQNINFSANYGMSYIPNKIEVLSGDDFISYFNDIGGAVVVGSFRRDYAVRDENGETIAESYDYKGNPIWQMGTADMFTQHDWQDELFRVAPIQDYNLSFSGGSKTLDYLASFGYYTQDGTIIGSSYERYTGNFKLTSKPSDKFRISVNISTGYTVNDGILSASDDDKFSSGVINNLLLFRPVYGYDSNGVLVTDLTTDRETFDITNPMKLATEQENLSKNLYLRPSLAMTYEIIPGLEFDVKLSANLTNGKLKSWYPGSFGKGLQTGGGVAYLTGTNTLSWLNENLLSYKKTFNDHKINAVFGFSQQAMYDEYFSLSKNNFEIQSINVDNIGSGTSFQTSSGSDLTDWALRSWIGRANYTFKERYLFTFTGRADGSSKFPPGKKWVFFPSGAFAWRVGQEPFMNSLDKIDDLKLHVSYGKSGNQAIQPYSSRAMYDFSNYTYDGSTVASGLVIDRLDNGSLTWETTTQVDVGLDLTMFNSRLSFNAVYYDKLTDGLLLESQVPYTTGYESAWMNVGSVKNHGMEFTVNTVNVQTKDFTWSSSFNISFNKNKVKSLATGGDLDYFLVSGPGPLSSEYIVQVGEEVGSMYGYIFDGVYQLDQFDYNSEKYDPLVDDYQLRHIHPLLGGYKLKDGETTISGRTVLPGDMKSKDIAGAFDEDGNPIGDGVIDASDRTIIGHANPKHYGGFSNDLSYKNFDLSILLNWSYGNDVFNQNKAEGINMGDAFRNQYIEVLNRWQVTNQTNELWGVNGQTAGASTYYVEDGSFLRLSNITLGYNLPKQVVDKWKVSNARIYLSGDNLHVWTKYSGYDPEVSIGENSLAPGVDYGAYPRSRTFRIGVKLDF